MGSSHASLGALLDGKYLVDRELGSGGMGTVVSAVHQQLEQRVAIKLLHDDALDHPEIVERFKREARSVARLKNEHVVRVLDVGSLESGAPYMVMEHLDGTDLGELVAKEGPLALADAVGYVLEACEAVAEAHAARIIHRDLKPANLFLATQPGGGTMIKVLDFGIAKALDDPKKNLTRTTAMMGTAYYMSPEQLTASREVDSRTDIWALGVVLYELLSGRLPFESDNLVEIVGLILSNTPEPITSLRPDLPPAFGQIIASCMQSSLDERYQTVGDLAKALAQYGRPDDFRIVEKIERVAPPSTQLRPMWPSSPPPAITSASLKNLPVQRAPESNDTVVGVPQDMDGSGGAPQPAVDASLRTEVTPPPEMGAGQGRLASVFAIATVATLALVGGTLLLVKRMRAEPIETTVYVAEPGPPVLAPPPAPPPVVTVFVPVPVAAPSAPVAPAPVVHAPRPTAPRPPRAEAPQPAKPPGGGSLDMTVK